MAILEELKDLGWHLSSEGLDILSDSGQVKSAQAIANKALDCDLRNISDGAFPEDFIKDPTLLEKPIVVQIQKIRNVSAPKVNEESGHAPRMLKLSLCDGKTSITAIEIAHISSININTPPGTKILLKNNNFVINHGVIWLEPSSLKVLGGNVDHMIEKWELNRRLAKHTRGSIDADGGPPPWIPFGQRLDPQSVDRNFKSLQEAGGKGQDNAEFEAQRKGAIAEAQRLSGTKKVFGGGTKPMLDANVQKIVDAGFTEEQAEYALKLTKNNVDRALRNLQRREGKEEHQKKDKPESGNSKRKGKNKDDDEVQVKPTGKVSLFEFLSDKIPNLPVEKPSQSQTSTNRDYKQDRQQQQRNNRNNRNKPDNKFKPENRSDNTQSGGSRDERKFQPNEKPPRFQKKAEDVKRHNNYNNFNNQNNFQQQKHRNNYNNTSVDSLTQAASKLSITQTSQPQNVQQQHFQKPNQQNYNKPINNFNNQGLNTSVNNSINYRRNDDHKGNHQDGYNRRNHTNGYIENPGANSSFNFMNQGYHNGRAGYSGGYGGGNMMGSYRNQVDIRTTMPTNQVDWHIGDRCLALYWEDNNYYEAEITGISDNTVVVKFSAYGNHEEVLKSSCLPYPHSGKQQLPNTATNKNKTTNATGVGQRNRPTQQMYAPPARRT